MQHTTKNVLYKAAAITALGSLAACAISPHKAKADELNNIPPRWYVGGSLAIASASSDESSGKFNNASGKYKEKDTNGLGIYLKAGYIPGQQMANAVVVHPEIEFLGNQREFKQFKSGNTVANNAKTKVTTGAVMANGIVDINTGSRFVPYVGAGIGMASQEIKRSGLKKESDTVLAYQGMAGVSYNPESTPHLSYSLGYRYFDTAEASFKGGNKVDTSANHTFEVGMAYHF